MIKDENGVEHYALGESRAGGTVEQTYTYECERGHETRGTGNPYPCPWCLEQKLNGSKAETAALDSAITKTIEYLRSVQGIPIS